MNYHGGYTQYVELLGQLKMQIVTSAGKERLSRCSLELKLSQKCREEGTQALRPLWGNLTAASVDRPEEVEPYKDGRGLHNTFLTCQSLNEKIIWNAPTHNPWHMNTAMNLQRLRSHRVSQKSEYWDSSGIFFFWFLLHLTIPWKNVGRCVQLIESLLWWPINWTLSLSSHFWALWKYATDSSVEKMFWQLVLCLLCWAVQKTDFRPVFRFLAKRKNGRLRPFLRNYGRDRVRLSTWVIL